MEITKIRTKVNAKVNNKINIKVNDSWLMKDINIYINFLKNEEKSEATISKYIRDIKAFVEYMGEKELNKETVLKWKEHLMMNYAPSSVNSMLAGINSFLQWNNMVQFKVKPIKIQRDIFTKPEKELNEQEYKRLVEAANKGENRRLSLIIQTICATGIRVSELRYITVEALLTGRNIVENKGKSRTIFIPLQLCKILNNYCKKQKIKSGVIFRTKGGKPLDRSNIWRMMKNLCKNAGVDEVKVFPHNLRHLFARTYYTLEKDISRLADLLGHSNITTTRIYTMESGTKHIRQLEKMGLVLN